MEPMRLTTTVVKFSGTLGTTTRSDLRSLTVTAYAHYVAAQTACRYIFADIQGASIPSVPILPLTRPLHRRFEQCQHGRKVVAHII